MNPNPSEQVEILQFGTSRFLQAHVDFFIDQAAKAGMPIGKIAIVQTSDRAAGKMRVKAFNTHSQYQLLIQGMDNGKVIEKGHFVSSVECAFSATTPEDWEKILRLARKQIRYIVSNTADKGYDLFREDRLNLNPPRSFPGKILRLLLERYRHSKEKIMILPCELIQNNGEVLKEIVSDLAKQWELEDPFMDWMEAYCVWANTLVDRIVSKDLDPIGAIAEPYALWVIQKTKGLDLPFEHPSIKVVDDLKPFEMLKLGVLNLAHTFLVDQWLKENRPAEITTVLDALNHPTFFKPLNDLYENEVIPVLEAMFPAEDVRAYKDTVLDRLRNPFLEHQLASIAANHAEKIERRIRPIWEHSQKLFPQKPTPLLRSCLGIPTKSDDENI